MPHSYAIVIFNGDLNEHWEILQLIRLYFFRMDMKITFLLNRTRNQLDECLSILKSIDEDEIVDIICVIYAPQTGYREFKVDKEILDIYKDIIYPITFEKKFSDKKKVFLTRGEKISQLSTIGSDSARRTNACPTANIVIVVGKNDKFFQVFIPNLLREKGDVFKSIKNCSDEIEFHRVTTSNLTLKTPSAAHPDLEDRELANVW